MKPVDVSRQLGIGGSTVRAWSKEFAAYLSPTAVGGDDRRRDFTVRDVQVMALIKSMSDRNVSRDEMNLELRRLQADDWRELPMPEGTGTTDTPSMLTVNNESALAFNVERRALLREVATMQSTVEELKHELTAERSGRRADIERLMREIAEAQAAQREAETVLKLYEDGRLKPKGE
ncbi:MAG: MerR family transcriptional regulator [Chloroflexota bacterium]